MKIAIIASNADLLDQLTLLVRQHLAEDQFVLLQREQGELHLDRIDLASTSIVIVDSEKPDPVTLKSIADCTKERSNPVFIYLCADYGIVEIEGMMHAGVSDVIKMPVEPNELLQAIERIRKRRYLSAAYHPRGKAFTFISCKGGAGATFIATNLAYVLAERLKKKVLFIDLHMQGGDAAFYVIDKMHPETLGDIARQAGLDSTAIASAAI